MFFAALYDTWFLRYRCLKLRVTQKVGKKVRFHPNSKSDLFNPNTISFEGNKIEKRKEVLEFLEQLWNRALEHQKMYQISKHPLLDTRKTTHD